MRHKLGLPSESFIVLLAGQSVEGTSRGGGAVDYALEALNASGIDPFVLAIGRSSARVLERWGGKGVAVPYQEDPSALAEYYAAGDVTLVASLWETFGRIAAESQMCGVPVVGFATGGIPEIVLHEQTGLIVERLNASALGAALRTLHDCPDLRLRLQMLLARRLHRLREDADHRPSVCRSLSRSCFRKRIACRNLCDRANSPFLNQSRALWFKPAI